MAIIYKNNMKTHRYNSYSNDLNREKMECRITCRSFIFISLSLYKIYDENIIPSTKYIEIVSRNLSEIENENNNNMQRKNIMNHSDKTNESSISSKNNKSITLENKPYNDLSKNLTEKELYDVLNSLKECPSKEDLRNIWSHTRGIAKEGVDDIQREIKASIQKYLDNDISEGVMGRTHNQKFYVYKDIWDQYMSRFYKILVTEEILSTNNFFSLINNKHTLDDILKFIYSFLEHFKTLKKELHQKHQKEILESIAQNLGLLKKYYYKN
ncbi:Plasmodium exported protein (PHISTa-like), unknown, putative [Plasmodium gaboni]|uniref:Plasmodium RESA N-terminal domain-containing protein n=1 Tax=Plasmodium gaboni TaxID=647221 RepID=A0ABY0KW83_9APIC|nr:Plasmodium exported protein (PHISTa-like), unknown, putative [Plasmodium gaboni]